MTDYNDGKWHGWNGGECPVHPESEIEAFYMPKGAEKPWKFVNTAEGKIWGEPCLFRVIKPYVEPREGWIVPGQLYDSARQAKIAHPGVEPIHVREVKG